MSTKKQLMSSAAGFTIIEVSMSLVFIGFIILFLTSSLLALLGTYNKGVWLSKINSTVHQMRLDIADAAKYSARSQVLPDKNRLCVNGVSYLWNIESEIKRAERKDGYASLPNHWADASDAKRFPIRLVRIKDSNSDYCKQPDKQPTLNSPNVQSMLDSGVALQALQVQQGIGDQTDIPLLSIAGSISTNGINSPTRVFEKDGKINVLEDSDPNGRWQCGDWIDRNNNGKRDPGDEFRPSKAQFCAITPLDIVTYERGVII